MRNFLQYIFLFLLFGLILGEIIARTFALTSDIPRRKINNHKIQKYIPNQTGTWKGGEHNWQINKLGWPGELPKNYNNLITIIGDSYIENFMNPDSCHQSVYLKKLLPQHNFIEASRSGVSLMEAMEISRSLDSLKPKKFLVYVSDNDFYESVLQIKKMKDITQVDLSSNSIVYGQMKSSGIKNVLYNWKFLYYLYNRFPIDRGNNKKSSTKQAGKITVASEKYDLIKKLLNYISGHYNIDQIVLVFRPESDSEIIELCKTAGFQVVHLTKERFNKWSFEHDSHWTCNGHKYAATQVAEYLNTL